MAHAIQLRRRVLVDVYALFLNYPPGVIALIAGMEPRKALRHVQRIATRLWEKAEPYNERAVKIDELRDKILKPFLGREESIREMYAEKVAVRSTDEKWKAEQEALRDQALSDLDDAKAEALWKGGHHHLLRDHQQVDGMEYDAIELSKDLREMLARCFEKYVEDRLTVPEEEPTDEKEKKKPQKPRFVIQRRVGPFGGTQEVPIVLPPVAEAELEYALGDFSDEEERDLKMRIEQLWDGDRKQLGRTMQRLEEKHGPGALAAV